MCFVKGQIMKGLMESTGNTQVTDNWSYNPCMRVLFQALGYIGISLFKRFALWAAGCGDLENELKVHKRRYVPPDRPGVRVSRPPGRGDLEAGTDHAFPLPFLADRTHSSWQINQAASPRELSAEISLCPPNRDAKKLHGWGTRWTKPLRRKETHKGGGVERPLMGSGINWGKEVGLDVFQEEALRRNRYRIKPVHRKLGRREGTAFLEEEGCAWSSSRNSLVCQNILESSRWE